MEFVKLSDPVVEVEDGRLVWNTVSGANGYYIYYTVKDVNEMVLDSFITLYTEYPQMQNQIYWNAPTSFGRLDQSLTYYFGVRAINTINEMKLAPSSIGAVYQYDPVEEGTADIEYLDTLRPVTKLEAPNQLQLIDGTLKWREGGLDYNINLLGMTLNAGDKPFTYSAGVEKLADLSIVIKLEDINGTQRKYVVPAIKFFHAAIADGPIFSYVAEMLNLPENFEFGWPVLQWFTSELGSTVVPGVQSLSVSQKGNDYDWLDSNYTSSYDVYIAHAPATRISNYVLSWDAVSLPVTEYPYGATNKYTVVAENESGIRKYIHSTNNLSIDLRDLVNADILGSGRHKIYVMVTGDSSTYLYGLPSTPIEVLVLPNVNASIIGGVLDWASLSQAVTYNVIMDPNNINYRFESLMNAGPWDFKEIAVKNAVGEVLVYNLTIQAIGNGNNIISGKVTNMGQIIKLETPNMSVSQSVLVWPNILANEGYEIIIRRDGALLDSAYLPKDRTFYESKTSGFNNYNLRAVGTTSGSLNESSQSYAISSESAYGVYAVMLNSVTTARAHEGQLLWSNIKELNNVPVVGYKITFDDSHHKLPVYVTQFTPIILTGESYVLYTIDSNYSAGEYKLYIQPYSLNTYLREEDGKTYHYLLGGIVEQSSVEFIKLQNTLEIYAQDGVIMWTDNEPLSNTYKVVFTRETSQGTQTVTFYTNTNTFNPSALSKEDEQRYKDLIVGEQYSVKVQTLGDNVDLINSDETKRDGYTKLSTISTVEYDNDETGQEGFIIRWIFTNYVSEVTNYQYIIRYVNNATAEEFTLDSRESSAIKIGVDTLGRYYGQIDASLLMTENTQQLSFSIQVVPVETTALVLISDYSQVRSVTPPASLSGIFTYVAESRKIAWQYSAGGTDVSFRIIDEIVELDENNQVVGEALETRIYVSQVSEFYPELTGLHRIRVQVILTGAQVASPYVYFNYQMAQEGIINHDYLDEESPYTIVNFNLFDGGDGSQSNPYTITTQTQFENINQRLTKPSYMGGGRFYFKQNQNLTMTLANPIGAFAGVYDGNGKQLTWQISNLSAQKVALFISLEPNAEIKNVIVNAHIIQLEDSILPEVYLSALVSDNYGTIQNSQVKSINFETAVTRGIRYYFGSFASVNYGAITLCVNSANINFDIRNGIVHIGGIAYMNSSTTRGGISYIGTISQTGNTGNITVYASRFRIGGLVETTNIDSTIMQSYNKGDITATLTTGTQENYIGGLVAYNRGEIRNSYNIANALSANMSSYTRTIYIGGLSGFIEGQKGARISNCFTTTTNITTTNSSQATKYLASMVGLSGANSTTLQTTSYYTYSSNLSAINSPPSGFNFAQIGTYSALLTLLNNADYVFEQQNPSYPPRLRWEANFTIN